jgi:hypothetical protein
VQEGGRPQQFACVQDEGARPRAVAPTVTLRPPPCARVERGSVRQWRCGSGVVPLLVVPWLSSRTRTTAVQSGVVP